MTHDLHDYYDIAMILDFSYFLTHELHDYYDIDI
jgi:hypothetical protein